MRIWWVLMLCFPCFAPDPLPVEGASYLGLDDQMHSVPGAKGATVPLEYEVAVRNLYNQMIAQGGGMEKPSLNSEGGYVPIEQLHQTLKRMRRLESEIQESEEDRAGKTKQLQKLLQEFPADVARSANEIRVIAAENLASATPVSKYSPAFINALKKQIRKDPEMARGVIDKMTWGRSWDKRAKIGSPLAAEILANALTHTPDKDVKIIEVTWTPPAHYPLSALPQLARLIKVGGLGAAAFKNFGFEGVPADASATLISGLPAPLKAAALGAKSPSPTVKQFATPGPCDPNDFKALRRR